MALKNSVLYTNGVEERYFKRDDFIPDGWKQVKIFYINNGIENKRCYSEANIPEGWVKGKLPLSRNWTEGQHKHLSEETKQNISKSRKAQGTPWWEGRQHTEETKKKISESNLGKDAYNKGIHLTEEQKVLRDQNIINKYGSLENFYKSNNQKAAQTKLEKYGDASYNNREKAAATTFEHFGVNYYRMTDDFRKGHGNTSKYNDAFKKLLLDYNLYISDEDNKEFPIQNRLYDFKVGNTLIEIDPTITHNSTIGVFNSPPKDKFYHKDKTQLALDNGYRCIHIWDWDNPELIVKQLLEKEKVYARNCIIKEVSKTDCDKFLIENHFQGTCNNQTIRLGLFYNNDLVQVMTFGKPRYNKNYNYELLRLCTKSGYKIIGGSEKLFKNFVKNYSPDSIISYCDRAKFSGDVYNKLGFNLKKKYMNPSKHWYNIKTGRHITDNLLKQRGFDQLFGTTYGKGTSNIELMINAGFLEIYDCGQATYIWSKENAT